MKLNMNMKPHVKKALAISGIAAGVVLLTASGWSESGRLDKMTERVTKKLDLDESQQKQFKEMAGEVTKQFSASKESHEDMGDKLETLLEKDFVSADQLKQLFNERQTKHAATMNLLAEKMAAFHAILTPEQKKEFADMAEDFGEHGGRRFGKKHRRGHDDDDDDDKKRDKKKQDKK